jgi:hypothetical protein
MGAHRKSDRRRDDLCGAGLLQIELVGQFLEARSESFNLLLLLRGSHFGALAVQMPNLAE